VRSVPGNALVTGCNGFVGRHLTADLRRDGWAVFGVDRGVAAWADWIDYGQVDVADERELSVFIGKRHFDLAFHLAAVANPRSAAENPLEAVRSNILGSAIMYESCRRGAVNRLLVIGSSEQYKRAGPDLAVLTEDSEVQGSNVYGMTKVCAELCGRTFVDKYGCQIIFTRSFNHTGPGQSPAFVLSGFAKQCAEISLGLREPRILVGNIAARRSFLDVRDVMRAYRLLAQVGVAGETYNVCAAEIHSLRILLDILVSCTGRTDITIEVDPSRLRTDDPELIRGDPRKIHELTGWVPRVPIRETLENIYRYWLSELAR